MNIKDITILKSIEPITILDKPNPKTIESLAKLIQTPKFNEYVEAIRDQSNFPKEGISIKDYIGRNFSDLPTINKGLVKLSLDNTAHELCKSVGISDEFYSNLLLLLFFNAFIDLDYFKGFITGPIKFILGRKNISSSMFDYPYEVGSIIIPYNASQNTLVKWIKANWEIIQKQMDDNMTFNPYSSRIHKNTEIAFEIVNLKDRENKTFNEIADILTNKYPDDKRVADGEWIKKEYYDYKVMWNRK